VLLTYPKFLISSPAFKPAESAGLPSTTLLTLANAGRRGNEEAGIEEDTVAEFEGVPFVIGSSVAPLSARIAKCSWICFSITFMRSL
jgi:hypothetical protein